MSFLAIFYPFTLPPNNLENQNTEKMKRASGDVILHMCTKNDVWCMVPEIKGTTDRVFCHFGPFLPFDPPNNPKNQNFEKMKVPGDIIISHLCTTNDGHMMYGSWDMECDRHNFLSFWASFCCFTPLTTWKIKMLKKWKKAPGDIIILHFCTTNEDHMMYGSWDMKHGRQNFLSFWASFFLSCTALIAWKIKILKKWKKSWRYHHFTCVYHKWLI